jgi:hypothetical protein
MEDKGCWDGSITVYASWKIRDVGMGMLVWMSDMVAKFLWCTQNGPSCKCTTKIFPMFLICSLWDPEIH